MVVEFATTCPCTCANVAYQNRRRTQGVVCLCHQVICLAEARLWLCKCIFDYLPYFEKNKNVLALMLIVLLILQTSKL
jgi:hypothetical protein